MQRERRVHGHQAVEPEEVPLAGALLLNGDVLLVDGSLLARLRLLGTGRVIIFGIDHRNLTRCALGQYCVVL